MAHGNSEEKDLVALKGSQEVRPLPTRSHASPTPGPPGAAAAAKLFPAPCHGSIALLSYWVWCDSQFEMTELRATTCVYQGNDPSKAKCARDRLLA